MAACSKRIIKFIDRTLSCYKTTIIATTFLFQKTGTVQLYDRVMSVIIIKHSQKIAKSFGSDPIHEVNAAES